MAVSQWHMPLSFHKTMQPRRRAYSHCCKVLDVHSIVTPCRTSQLCHMSRHCLPHHTSPLLLCAVHPNPLLSTPRSMCTAFFMTTYSLVAGTGTGRTRLTVTRADSRQRRTASGRSVTRRLRARDLSAVRLSAWHPGGMSATVQDTTNTKFAGRLLPPCVLLPAVEGAVLWRYPCLLLICC
jgi:hypothetical protein